MGSTASDEHGPLASPKPAGPPTPAESQPKDPIVGNETEKSTRPTTKGSDSELSDLDSNAKLSPPAAGQDGEIVVSANSDTVNNDDTILVTDNEREITMTDAPPADAPEPESATQSLGYSPYPKRKRTSLYDSPEAGASRPKSGAAMRAAISQGITKVIVGTWRDSPAPDHVGKHAVVAFIDAKDRLRTRVQQRNLDGDHITGQFPLRPGAGGTWVTFDRVIFREPFLGQYHHVVKEAVRIRSTDPDAETINRDREDEVLKEALAKVEEHPELANEAGALQVALGPEDPEAPGPALKKRRSAGGFTSINAAVFDGSPAPRPPINGNPMALDPLPGTRPTRVTIGYWKGSSEELPEDRHAVLGVLGANDFFRVKLMKSTRDGRALEGNFPNTPGGMWISFESDVVLEPHLTNFTKNECKEYVRVRQFQMDLGERPEEQAENEKKAAESALERCRQFGPLKKDQINHIPRLAPMEDEVQASGIDESPVEEIGRRPLRRHPLPDHTQRGVSSPVTSRDPADPDTQHRRGSSQPRIRSERRIDAIAQNQLARAEATQHRAELLARHREMVEAAGRETSAALATAKAAATTPGPSSTVSGNRDMEQLNDVWVRQEALRTQSESDAVKFYHGIKYERKNKGPFIGKLVSKGFIINIDGEDYVEYRVLTKPAFF